ncbi:MAG: lipopolysaccharide transport system permease protein [Chloroflexota bacterium]|nr:lipopolysaccharide transport system permease protein [Chloroflexota bacterium]
MVTWESRERLTAVTVRAIRDVIRHLGLFWLLTVKDLKIKYKASAIGLFWSLLNPLLLVIVYTAIFGTIFHSQKPEYPVFILSGLLAWNFFGTTLPAATVSIVSNANLIRKTRFPTSLLPMSVVLSGFINFVISLALLFGLVVFYRHPLGWSLLALPVLLVAQLAFTAGLSLLLSSLNVFFRDVEHFLAILLTVWFFATPIIYPRELIQGKSAFGALILDINPMAWLVSCYQQVFYGIPQSVVRGGAVAYTGSFQSTWPDALPFWGFVLLSLALLAGGFTVFAKLSRRFVEEV